MMSIDNIDRVLLEANMNMAEMNYLHFKINNDRNCDKNAITARVKLIFWNMTLKLYSVLDQVYSYVYYHYNDQVLWVNAPFNQYLKWSEDTTRNPFGGLIVLVDARDD